MIKAQTRTLTPWIVALMIPAMIISLFAVAVALTPAAGAHDMPYTWAPPRTASWVGTCGSNRKNLVYAVQGMMLSGQYYAQNGYSENPGTQLDGVMGTKTIAGIQDFQTDHDLEYPDNDGCVGPNTWNKLRYYTHTGGSHLRGGWGNFLWEEKNDSVDGGVLQLDWYNSDWYLDSFDNGFYEPGYLYYIWEGYSGGTSEKLCDHTSCNAGRPYGTDGD